VLDTLWGWGYPYNNVCAWCTYWWGWRGSEGWGWEGKSASAMLCACGIRTGGVGDRVVDLLQDLCNVRDVTQFRVFFRQRKTPSHTHTHTQTPTLPVTHGQRISCYRAQGCSSSASTMLEIWCHSTTLQHLYNTSLAALDRAKNLRRRTTITLVGPVLQHHEVLQFFDFQDGACMPMNF